MSAITQDELHRYPKGHPDAPFERLNPTLAFNYGSGRPKVSQEKACRICHDRQDLSRHHLVPQAWFLGRKPELRRLRNANANIVPLCVSCHRILDGVNDPVGRLQKRAMLRERLYNNEVAFILQVRGQQWFDDEYPIEP